MQSIKTCRGSQVGGKELTPSFPPHTVCWGLMLATGLSIQMQSFQPIPGEERPQKKQTGLSLTV